MAQILLYALTDPESSRRVGRASEGMFRCLPDLERVVLGTGRFSMLLAAAPLTPLSWKCDEEGRFAAVLGEAIPPGSGDRMDAEAFGGMWKAEDRLESWDGYHALLQWDERSGVLLAGCDRLGLFPLYYLDRPGVVAISSSPSLLRSHPAYSESLDKRGLVGMLMTRATFGGRTLSRSIRRLEPGHVARLSLGGTPREVFQWAPTPLDDGGAMERGRIEEHLEVFHDCFRDAARRHFRSGSSGLQLLSGGLDSRMLAGLLREQGMAPPAVTIGGPFQVETVVARKVARHLSRRIVRIADPYRRHMDVARWVVDWEDLGSGFYFFLSPLLLSPKRLRHLGMRIFAGFQMDFVAGGPEFAPTTFDEHLAKGVHRLGWSPDQLRSLLLPEFGEAIDEAIDDARRDYDAAPADPYRRAWLLGLPLCERHVVGIDAWHASFTRWPSLLTLDEKVLRTCLTIPGSSMMDRRCQVELVVRRWPDLAELPLDRNDFDDRPLLEPPGGHGRSWASRIRQRLHMHLGVETRFFHRLYGMDTPQWRAIRRMAEGGRDSVSRWFDRGRFAEALPPAGADLPPVRDELADTVRSKLLLGLMLRASARGL